MKALLRSAHEAHRSLDRYANVLGDLLVEAFHLIALFAIGGTVAWSAGVAFLHMVAAGHASVEDVLLLFIYLELGAMVGIYFKTRHMPVRFLIYVGITALTRMLIGVISHDHTPNWGILIIAGGILLLALGVLVLRYGSHAFPGSGHLTDLRVDADLDVKP